MVARHGSCNKHSLATRDRRTKLRYCFVQIARYEASTIALCVEMSTTGRSRKPDAENNTDSNVSVNSESVHGRACAIVVTCFSRERQLPMSSHTACLCASVSCVRVSINQQQRHTSDFDRALKVSNDAVQRRQSDGPRASADSRVCCTAHLLLDCIYQSQACCFSLVSLATMTERACKHHALGAGSWSAPDTESCGHTSLSPFKQPKLSRARQAASTSFCISIQKQQQIGFQAAVTDSCGCCSLCSDTQCKTPVGKHSAHVQCCM